MEMERRWGVRKPVTVDVVVDNQPACLLRAQIGDISIGGLFVRTEAPQTLHRHARVELVLMPQQNGATRVYRLPATVVRLSTDGAGLMFDEYDLSAFRTLVLLLFGDKKLAATRPASAMSDDSNARQPRLNPDASSKSDDGVGSLPSMETDPRLN